MTFKYLCLNSALLALTPTLLWGTETTNPDVVSFSQCPADSYSSLQYTPPPVFSDDSLGATDVSAEQVQNIGKSISIFTGDVLIEQHQLRLHADKAIHNKDTQKLQLEGKIHGDTGNMAISADSGWLNLQTNAGEFVNSTYYMPETHLLGKAPLFSISENNTSILLDTQFSTCPPGKQDWHLDTAWLELDQNRAVGTAKHTVFWLSEVPVFYFPWIQFPLGDERRSGLLTPSIGSSSSKGFEFSLPWYWNIAPNQDAVITPVYMNNRGPMLATDYRYLSHTSRGNLNFEYLNNDKELNEQRYLFHFDNKSIITDKLSFNLLLNDASDAEYLKDMGSNFSTTNITHLERNANFNYAGDSWSAGLMAQTFQTIDNNIALNNRPYRRLPQITLQAKEDYFESDNSYLQASLNTEWVEFEHESTTKAQGSRFHIYPKLSLPVESNAWFIKPSAGYIFTQYDTTDTTGVDANLDNRGLSVISLDSGLFFERDMSASSFIQTLEPRLFYLNIPYKDQSAIPVFDSSKQDFSFASLFRENRFNGIDRIGDANQLTLALSSRILNKNNGRELFNISIGQIYYFEDQRVSLNNIVNTSNNSDIITEVGGSLNRWKARATYQWNTETDSSDKRSVQLNYATSNKSVFNIGYRFYRDPINEINNLEQTDLSFVWPFARNYSLLSRWNYSLTEERDNATMVGIEYESCCWAIRLLSQRYITDSARNTDDPYNTSIMLQFVLKGFGSITDKEATNTLKYAILGYQPDF